MLPYDMEAEGEADPVLGDALSLRLRIINPLA